MPLRKPWLIPSEESLHRTPGALGVYEIGNDAGEVVYIGFAGGRSRYGLRGEIARHLDPDGTNQVTGTEGGKFRYEVNMMYMTRYIELLERHRDLLGDLPPGNRQPDEYVPRLGRPVVNDAGG